jgi:hypothetical protein
VQDLLTGDEIISDSYDLKEIDGVVYEADCKKISVGGETFGAHPNLPRNMHLRLTKLQTLVPTLPLRRLRRASRMPRSRRSMLSTLSVSTRLASTRRATSHTSRVRSIITSTVEPHILTLV